MRAPTGTSMPPRSCANNVIGSPSGSLAAIACGNIGSVNVIRDGDVAESLLVGRVPQALALSADETTLCVANSGSDSVTVLDATAHDIVGTVPVGRVPMGIAVAEVPQICAGDCDADGTVRVDEVVRAVAIALNGGPATSCDAADTNGDSTVTVGEVVAAVGRVVHGCE